ncbi:hydrolase 1, exosortase A system-associated [Sphingorhabdus arenilitoris]|uniref:Hydrolase 1, exosortase A system-associated n=1 Tax=Sphingorhabdus arenilitoris TaxID=1490041 RepID=A0ABV8RHA5_9SPHN
MRRMIGFMCEGHLLTGTLDEAPGDIGLLIVSGGNEIRCGAHGGQAQLAAQVAALGHPVLRYDRRGIGDSEGSNSGFMDSRADIAAAIAAFRREAPALDRIIAFGNCDAASALALFHDGQLDGLILANPWVIEEEQQDDGEAADTPTKPSAAAIRARYWDRIKNPRSLIDLFTGKIDLKKLVGGLMKAAKKDQPTGLAIQIAAQFSQSDVPVHLLIAKRDTTAMAFMGAWNSDVFNAARGKENIRLSATDSTSHSFASDADKKLLLSKILEEIGSEGGT